LEQPVTLLPGAKKLGGNADAPAQGPDPQMS
jgi:hypothetical protein